MSLHGPLFQLSHVRQDCFRAVAAVAASMPVQMATAGRRSWSTCMRVFFLSRSCFEAVGALYLGSGGPKLEAAAARS